MTNRNLIFRGFVFVLLIYMLDLVIGSSLRNQYFRLPENYQGGKLVLASKGMAYDVVILGSSRAAHHYNSKLLGDTLRKEVYNFGVDGESIFYNYVNLLLLSKNNFPKTIILDVFPIDLLQYSLDDYYKLNSLLPLHGMSSEVDSILCLNSPFEQFKLVSKIYPYNSMITKLVNSTLSANTGDTFLGFSPLLRTMSDETPYLKYSDLDVDSNKVRVFYELIEMSLRNNSELIVCLSPFWGVEDESMKSSKRIVENILKEKNVRYFDFSQSNNNGFIYSDFADAIHLNKSGSTKFTNMLIEAMLKEDNELSYE